MSLSPGTCLGPYEIVAALGKGGMGEVWRAKDTRLGREVALKFLPEGFADDPERHARFEREAKVLASLNHPNIAVLYGLEHLDGQHALAMELVEGEGLDVRIARGPVAVDEAVPIALQIAEAFEAAHEKGIVHRDLKPANVRVRADGVVKVLDFGLAKAWEDPAGDSDPAHSPTVTGVYTRAGVILGTVAYMSPEQARGKPVDKRTDIWAFGVVLWEMLVGRPLFAAGTVSDTLAAVLKTEVPFARLPSSTPDAIRGLLRRCLERDSKNRLRDIGEARVALGDVGTVEAAPAGFALGGAGLRVPSPPSAGMSRRSRWRLAGALAFSVAIVIAVVVLGLRAAGWPPALFGPPIARPIRSLAVLPLENLSGDPGQAYFADGMTEALINTLAQIGALSVISRTTVMQFKGTRLTLPEIARRLNDIDAVIEGSVQRSGPHVRVSVQLVRAATDTPLWAKDYEREMSDVLSLQGEVARAIAEQVRVELTPGERTRLAASGRVDPEAYDLYLRGRAHSRHENREDNDQAIALLERAVAADPSFAAAHAELAWAYGIRHFFFYPDDAELERKSRLEVETALRLDPQSSDAHLARGVLLWDASYHFPYAESIRELRRAIELNPSSDEAHSQLGLVYLHIGLLDQALREAQEALRLNPGNMLAIYRLGCVRLYMRDYQTAWDVFSKIPLDSNPVLLNYVEAWTLFELGRKAEARARTDEYERAYPRDVGGLNASLQALLAADEGAAAAVEAKIRAAVEHGKGYRHFHHTEYNVATAYALLGRPSQALQWLQAAADDGLPCYPLFETDPNLDRIRNDPGFVAFLARQKQQWEAFGRL
ncbi:MAG: protein kinase [Thermoanaerobaculales bacterium]